MVIPDVLELREVRLREHLGLGVFGLEAPLFGGCQFRLRVGVLTTRTLVEPLRLALRALLRRRPQAAREVLHADVERAVGEEEIGRASCRESVYQDGLISVVAGSLKKKKTKQSSKN